MPSYICPDYAEGTGFLQEEIEVEMQAAAFKEKVFLVWVHDSISYFRRKAVYNYGKIHNGKSVPGRIYIRRRTPLPSRGQGASEKSLLYRPGKEVKLSWGR